MNANPRPNERQWYYIRPSGSQTKWNVLRGNKLICRCDSINAALAAAGVIVEPELIDPLSPIKKGIDIDALLKAIEENGSPKE